MRFRASLAFSFLVFIVALVSVRAKETHPLSIKELRPPKTWIEGETAHIAVDAHFYGTSFKYTSAGAWLRRRGMEDVLLAGFKVLDNVSTGFPVKVPQLAEGNYDVILVHEPGGTLLAMPVQVRLKKNKS